MISQSQSRHIRDGQRGYVLLTLLLMMAVMGIVAATLVTSLKFDIQRDREEEMIHRGVQYSRAIRAYYKKFGRYPANLENLENTNQMRFLRKRYKDPITGNNFKLLHFGEVKMGLAGMPGMGGGVIPGAKTIGPNGKLTSSGDSASSLGDSTQKNLNSSGQNAQVSQDNTDSAQTEDASADAGDKEASDNGDQNSEQTFGGMPVVGVASTSREVTIREFDRKKKYNEWKFVYDPSLDRGFLITTPYQPQLQMFGTGPQNVNGPGQVQTPGLGTAAPGTAVNPGANSPPAQTPNQPTDIPVQQ
jgi:type II secretory pathway pseudopilin PulG